jgi:hypothetical protein
MSKTKSSAAPPRASRTSRGEAAAHVPPNQATRETVESIALAVVLAFLVSCLRRRSVCDPDRIDGPDADGTTQGRGSVPNVVIGIRRGPVSRSTTRPVISGRWKPGIQPMRSAVIATTCPMCRYTQSWTWHSNANAATFSGDRILVSKFVYDFTSPQRWDVIVFKYPFNAKQNFIKRLVGLPNEEILMRQGDVFVKQPDEKQIIRSPQAGPQAQGHAPTGRRLRSHISERLTEIGWPLRWQAWSAGRQDGATWSSPTTGTHVRDGRAGRSGCLAAVPPHHRQPISIGS